MPDFQSQSTVRRGSSVSVRQKIMPVWLQIIGAVLGAIGSILGFVNAWLQWREKRERLELYWADRDLLTLRIYNPTSRTIEILGRVFEVWSEEKGAWIADGFLKAVGEPECLLEPYRSVDFMMSPEVLWQDILGRRCRVRVKTGSGREYAKEVKHRPNLM